MVRAKGLPPTYRRDKYKRYRRYYQKIVPLLKKPATRAYMGFILTLFTISFFAFFAIRPTANTIVELLKKIEDGKYTNRKLAEKITALSSAQNTYFQLIDDLVVVEEALPGDVAMENYVKQLENVILASKMQILSSRVDEFKIPDDEEEKREKVKKDEADGIKIAISAGGGYDEVLNLLTNLHKLRRLTTIEGVTIDSSREEVNRLMVTIQAKTYFVGD